MSNATNLDSGIKLYELSDDMVTSLLESEEVLRRVKLELRKVSDQSLLQLDWDKKGINKLYEFKTTIDSILDKLYNLYAELKTY